MRSLLTLIVVCPAVLAQDRWEMSMLYGGVSAPAVVVAATPTQAAGTASQSVGLAYQWNTAHLLESIAAGSLYLEVPLTFTFNGQVAGLSRGASYFTPGVHFTFPEKKRISFYAALGGGFADFGVRDSIVNGVRTAAEDQSGGHATADIGGGIDLRLERFISLRVDGRDYITPAGLGGTTGRNHPVFVAGIAFHL